MITLLDPMNIDHWAYDLGNFEILRKFSVNEGGYVGWNYPMDYSFIAMCFEDLYAAGKLSEDMSIIDIGAGPGAIHGYLEDKYGLNILGIDIQKIWEKDYIDIQGDFSDDKLRSENGIINDSVDIVIAVSSLEHTPKDKHKSVVQICKKCLKSGGHLMSTGGAGIESNTENGQYNLSKKDLCDVYDDEFDKYDYEDVLSRWENHREMMESYKERYKTKIGKMNFVTYGVFQEIMK